VRRGFTAAADRLAATVRGAFTGLTLTGVFTSGRFSGRSVNLELAPVPSTQVGQCTGPSGITEGDVVGAASIS
jgi:hypothetical protein